MKLSTALTALGAVTLCVGIAQAADLPTRGPIYKAAPLVPAWTWTGAYVGAHAGYGWGTEPGGGEGVYVNTSIKGGFGGVQIGYNWQPTGSKWVVGLEADVSGGAIGLRTEGELGAFYSWNTNLMGSVRGRLGFAITPQTLLYGTGGFAWARNKAEAHDTLLSVPSGLYPLEGSSSATHVGWAVGAGVEHAFAQNWSVRLEYLHTDYDSKTYFNTPLELAFRIDQVRVGINYMFH